MKSKKDIALCGGHTLKYVGGDIWDFVPSQPDGRIYLTFNSERTDIIALDADSIGMPLMVGCTVSEYKIYGIHYVDGVYKVCMLPLYKENPSDLVVGDVIYVTHDEEYSIKKFVIGTIRDNEDYILLWNKDDEHDCVVLKTKGNVNLRNGVNVEATIFQKVFTDEKNAKKYLFDVIQDEIMELKAKQRKLYQ